MEDSQRNSKQKLCPFDEQEIPQPHQDVQVEVVGKQACEPLQCGHARFIITLFEMHRKSWQFLLDKVFHNFLINSGTKHVLKVINWHQVLNNTSKCPESFLFCHDLQQTSNYEVETLAVSYMGISHAVCSAYPRNGIKYLLTQLLIKSILPGIFVPIETEETLIIESPWHINFNLMFIWCWETFVVTLNQSHIISIVLFQR